jgi:hypothetical protein
MTPESRNLVSDVRNYFLKNPPVSTLIEHASPAEREDYSQRIMQRLGISVEKYVILNIHGIGIDAPAKLVFEELLTWDQNSLWWPNHIASVERVNDSLEHIYVYLLGRRRSLFGIRSGFLGLDFIPLFEFKALRHQHVPDPADFDNARYLLYECGGGYPIGVSALYVRSSIVGRDEPERTQLFFMVGFNFYGKADWSKPGIVSRTWEAIHNRVTANALNRFKQLCESEFGDIRQGRSSDRRNE